MDLSVVVPIFNTEKSKLNRCFSSLSQRQNFNYEVILVDDGSKKEIADYCMEYAKRIPHFVYIRKENGGVSSARNLGIKVSKGKYISFVDSDDIWLPSGMLAELMNSRYGIIAFDMIKVINGNHNIQASFSGEHGIKSREECCDRIITSSCLNSVATKLFNKQVLETNNILFDESMVSGEDICFVIDVINTGTRIYYCSENIYIYYLDYSTFFRRTMNNSESIFRDRDKMFLKKLNLIQSSFFDKRIKEDLYSQLVMLEIEGLFNTVSELCVLNHLPEERKNWLSDRMKQFERSKKISLKSQIKAFLMIGQHWSIIKITGYLREIYLKLKKTI